MTAVVLNMTKFDSRSSRFFPFVPIYSRFFLFLPVSSWFYSFLPVYSSNITPGVWHWLPWPCSFLKSHSFKRGHTENPYCNCNLGHVEDPTHYLIKCNLYNEQRQILVGQMEQFIPNFDVLSDKRKLEILLMGYEYQNPEMTKINTKIMFISQSYILKTKRFSKSSWT